MFVEASACLLVTCSSRLFRHAFKPRASRWRCDMRHRQSKNVGKGRKRGSVCSLRKQIGKAMYRHTITQQTRTLAIHSGKKKKEGHRQLYIYIYIVYIYRPVSLSLTVSYVLYVHHRVFSREKKEKSSAARHFTIVPRAPHVKHARHFVVFCISFCFYHTHAHTSLARYTYAHTHARFSGSGDSMYTSETKENSMTRSRHGTQRRVRIGGNSCFALLFSFFNHCSASYLSIT